MCVHADLPYALHSSMCFFQCVCIPLVAVLERARTPALSFCGSAAPLCAPALSRRVKLRSIRYSEGQNVV